MSYKLTEFYLVSILKNKPNLYFHTTQHSTLNQLNVESGGKICTIFLNKRDLKTDDNSLAFNEGLKINSFCGIKNNLFQVKTLH